MIELTNQMSEDLAKAFEANSLDYTLRKLAEECIEVAEVCIKMVNKPGSDKAPTRENLALELGDLAVRAINIMDREEFIGLDLEVAEAMKAKYIHLHERIEKYKGQL
jgi:NTP pyrophosphatase (non-canonical NTP hydrolase)